MCARARVRVRDMCLRVFPEKQMFRQVFSLRCGKVEISPLISLFCSASCFRFQLSWGYRMTVITQLHTWRTGSLNMCDTRLGLFLIKKEAMKTAQKSRTYFSSSQECAAHSLLQTFRHPRNKLPHWFHGAIMSFEIFYILHSCSAYFLNLVYIHTNTHICVFGCVAVFFFVFLLFAKFS